MPARMKQVARDLYQAYQNLQGDDGGHLAASVSFYLAVSFFPLLAGADLRHRPRAAFFRMGAKRPPAADWPDCRPDRTAAGAAIRSSPVQRSGQRHGRRPDRPADVAVRIAGGLRSVRRRHESNLERLASQTRVVAHAPQRVGRSATSVLDVVRHRDVRGRRVHCEHEPFGGGRIRRSAASPS